MLRLGKKRFQSLQRPDFLLQTLRVREVGIRNREILRRFHVARVGYEILVKEVINLLNDNLPTQFNFVCYFVVDFAKSKHESVNGLPQCDHVPYLLRFKPSLLTLKMYKRIVDCVCGRINSGYSRLHCAS